MKDEKVELAVQHLYMLAKHYIEQAELEKEGSTNAPLAVGNQFLDILEMLAPRGSPEVEELRKYEARVRSQYFRLREMKYSEEVPGPDKYFEQIRTLVLK